MDESVLWAIAIGAGVLGLLLLAMAGAVAVYWNTVARKPKRVTSADKTQSHAGDVAATARERSPASSSKPQPTIGSSPWLWVKAWLFAILHAGTVSVVMGGVTLFEDLSKASDEIQSAGTVTFPKQLLPGTLVGPTSRERLSQSSDDSAKAEGSHEAGEPGRTGAASADGPGWEVVDLVSEVGADSRR
jgi:hypothetical protein